MDFLPSHTSRQKNCIRELLPRKCGMKSIFEDSRYFYLRHTTVAVELDDIQKSRLARGRSRILCALAPHLRMAHPRLSKLRQRALLQPKSCLIHNKPSNTMASNRFIRFGRFWNGPALRSNRQTFIWRRNLPRRTGWPYLA